MCVCAFVCVYVCVCLPNYLNGCLGLQGLIIPFPNHPVLPFIFPLHRFWDGKCMGFFRIMGLQDLESCFPFFSPILFPTIRSIPAAFSYGVRIGGVYGGSFLVLFSSENFLLRGSPSSRPRRMHTFQRSVEVFHPPSSIWDTSRWVPCAFSQDACSVLHVPSGVG